MRPIIWKESALVLVFLVSAIGVVLYDIKTMRIPNWLNYSTFAVLLLLRTLLLCGTLPVHLLAAACAAVLFALVRLLTKGGMGWGDVKYSAVCGLFAGPLAASLGFALSCLCAASVFAIRCLFGKKPVDRAFPFGPYMAGGVGLVYVVSLFV